MKKSVTIFILMSVCILIATAHAGGQGMIGRGMMGSGRGSDQETQMSPQEVSGAKIFNDNAGSATRMVVTSLIPICH
jgi:hypothetical protein